MFKKRPSSSPIKSIPLFYIRAYPTDYHYFSLTVVDRKYPWSPDRKINNRRLIIREGFKSRSAALAFAYRVIRIRTRWEQYVRNNEIEVEIGHL